MKLIENRQQKQRIKSLKSWTLAALAVGFLLAVSRFMLHFADNGEERKEERQINMDAYR